MLSLCIFFVFLATFSLLALSFSVHKRKQRKTEHEPTQLTRDPILPDPPPETEHPAETGSAQMTAHPLLLEILPSESPKWERLFEPDPGPGGSGRVEEPRPQGGKRRKKRAKRKSSSPGDEDEDEDEEDEEEEEEEEERCFSKSGSKEEQLVCLCPFTSSSSVTQRKIKQHYDELMKSHHSKGLTLLQVGQFANCLVEAKNELQHKGDVIQRKFTITKALLFKADRSSFDRLRQQIYKLELDQKRLEEDVFVYNWLQQQLKLSPAYKKMLEISARMEMKAKSGELIENTESEYSDITFEELLAQEKKDSFWQRNGKLRPRSS